MSQQQDLPLSAPLEARGFEARCSCQNAPVDVRSRQSINLAVQKMEACLNDSHRLPCWWNTHPRPFRFQPFILKCLTLMLSFKQSALFLAFSPHPLSLQRTCHSVACFNEADTLKCSYGDLCGAAEIYLLDKMLVPFSWLLGQDIEQLNKHVCKMSRKTNNPLLFVDGGSPTWGRGSCYSKHHYHSGAVEGWARCRDTGAKTRGQVAIYIANSKG